MASRMKEVAQRAGVSVTTVLHVLNKTRYVSLETRKSGQRATQELRFYRDARAGRLATGRSNFFGLIVSDIVNPFFPEIIRGFESAALARGFDTLVFDTNYDTRRTESGVRMMTENKVRGVAACRNLLGQGPPPTAILCSNDLTTIGAVAALREAGLQTPQGISVIGFDDIYLAGIATPPRTTVSLPRDRVGSLAFEALRNILRTKKRQGNEYVIETDLIVRESTGRPKNSGG